MSIRVPLDVALRVHGLPAPVRELAFHPVRKWRFDLAWPALFVAAEFEGGHYCRGRHVQPKGYAEDCVKYSEAALLGWTVVRVVTDHVASGLAVELVRAAISSATPEWVAAAAARNAARRAELAEGGRA